MAGSPFKLRPMEMRDYDAAERVMAEAFVDSIMPMLFPTGKTEADREHGMPLYAKHMKDPNTSIRRMLVIDSSVPPRPEDLVNLTAADRTAAESEGRIVGIAYWNFWPKDRTDEELAAEKAADHAEGQPPSADPAFCEAFFGAIDESKKEVLGGRAHILLHILATDPQYHRRGVGAMQLKWGLDEADRLGIPAYLEASEYGAPLYQRWGFEPLRYLGLHEKWYGGEKHLDPLLMLRPAKARSSEVAT